MTEQTRELSGITAAERAVMRHREFGGKMQSALKCSVSDYSDFADWYTPGVAAACRAIVGDADQLDRLTNRGNTVAIVSDGTRVLGLGNIGPEAGLPVMEGKALLFKYLGGVDAVPLCIRPRSDDEFIAIVRSLEPSFGGINLEDISQPRCFRILDTLRESMSIPVWHDDQQGTATVTLAALQNALQIVGKSLSNVRIAMIGMGAANVATYRLLKRAGADSAAIIACDSRGLLHRGRTDIEERQTEFADKWRVCCETNSAQQSGRIAEALHEADVCLAFSQTGPDVIRPEWISQMATDAIVFACSNPVPEVPPEKAKAAGARIVATGRSDFPNQVNNSLVFPGLFRGALDVRAERISDDMALAAANELAAQANRQGLREEHIVPRMDEWEMFADVAAAVAEFAVREGVARAKSSRDEVRQNALASISQSRKINEVLNREGLLGRAQP
ncbi:MAG: NAD(P)-dependent malic enzyme [Planctomycetota bacterium]|jgi:malate dehydrogenase (oxaloacetate-decarboxylating)